MDRLAIQSSLGKALELETHTPESGTKLTRSGSTSSYTPKLVKLDFPHFDEKEDPTSWICRAEQFFQFHQTPDEDQVEIASFHMVGDAQLWYQLLKQENLVITWADFKEGFFSRYGPNQLIDYFGEFLKLQQHGTVQTYQSQFEKLLAKVEHLSQARQVGCFVSGLIPSIRIDVQANRPKTLSEAIALARLCKKLFSIQAVLADSDEDTNMEIEEQIPTSEIPAISLHAIAGFEGPETMRLIRKVLGLDGVILVDSGNTHNFVSEQYARKAGLEPSMR
ncbi:uncharacterized protein LOC110619611 [Manihot esculenta]|nr:uncharacterized protein LOC110619611 [Manihot esculenta]